MDMTDSAGYSGTLIVGGAGCPEKKKTSHSGEVTKGERACVARVKGRTYERKKLQGAQKKKRDWQETQTHLVILLRKEPLLEFFIERRHFLNGTFLGGDACDLVFEPADLDARPGPIGGCAKEICGPPLEDVRVDSVEGLGGGEAARGGPAAGGKVHTDEARAVAGEGLAAEGAYRGEARARLFDDRLDAAGAEDVACVFFNFFFHR